MGAHLVRATVGRHHGREPDLLWRARDGAVNVGAREVRRDGGAPGAVDVDVHVGRRGGVAVPGPPRHLDATVRAELAGVVDTADRRVAVEHRDLLAAEERVGVAARPVDAVGAHGVGARTDGHHAREPHVERGSRDGLWHVRPGQVGGQLGGPHPVDVDVHDRRVLRVAVPRPSGHADAAALGGDVDRVVEVPGRGLAAGGDGSDGEGDERPGSPTTLRLPRSCSQHAAIPHRSPR